MGEQKPRRSGADSAPVTGSKTCANCGDSIDEHEWFPIRGREDDDGEFRLYSFCSEECAEAWEADGP